MLSIILGLSTVVISCALLLQELAKCHQRDEITSHENYKIKLSSSLFYEPMPSSYQKKKLIDEYKTKGIGYVRTF